ncbi:hypothetical protein HPP92_011066 [Vanilla planifolia]|uniref:Uncharacterized protein n=1 Tax=Vanilla planifolia TaxID=51239 RepID=A0A835QYB2_VANPL|nr:hypothetical protein HPP92_011066 [Vanilla planifolia]
MNNVEVIPVGRIVIKQELIGNSSSSRGLKTMARHFLFVKKSATTGAGWKEKRVRYASQSHLGERSPLRRAASVNIRFDWSGGRSSVTAGGVVREDGKDLRSKPQLRETGQERGHHDGATIAAEFVNVIGEVSSIIGAHSEEPKGDEAQVEIEPLLLKMHSNKILL